MEKLKIGIPRGLYYYEYGNLYKKFFEKLGFEVIVSKKTDNEIYYNGNNLATDEMCLSLKIFLGHINYLKDKCDYIIIPRIDNFGLSNQTCTNFLALYDICNNLFDINILNYNIDLNKDKDEIDGFLEMGNELKINPFKVVSAYEKAKEDIEKKKRFSILKNVKNLESENKKILLLSHSYNLYDELIGKPVVKMLEKQDITVIYPNVTEEEILMKESKKISHDLYWKNPKLLIGSLSYLKDKIDGVVFLTSFPCALDSISFELAMRKTKIPYLNLVVDNLNGLAGIETRIEIFADILKRKTYA